MQVQPDSMTRLGLCFLALLVLIQQVSSAPALSYRTNVQRSDVLLSRKVRMTPLWRILGSKPPGAYCYNHIECTTRLCRSGHCSYSTPVHS